MAEVEQKLGTTVKKCVSTCLLPVTHSQVIQRTIISVFKIKKTKHKAILTITLQPTQRQTVYPSLAPTLCTVVPVTVNVGVLRMLNSVTSLPGWSVHHSQYPMLFGHSKALLHPLHTTQALLKPSTDCLNNQSFIATLPSFAFFATHRSGEVNEVKPHGTKREYYLAPLHPPIYVHVLGFLTAVTGLIII